MTNVVNVDVNFASFKFSLFLYTIELKAGPLLFGQKAFLGLASVIYKTLVAVASCFTPRARCGRDKRPNAHDRSTT